VTVVRGDRNVGAAGNRNRLLPFLSGDELVLYADADLEPESRQVDWVSEGLFAVRADLFRATGYEVRFEPGITACHLEIDVRGEPRQSDFREGQFLFYQKHWGMSRPVFDRLVA
jgi:hypothetical protein